jgi:hypothetical protein
MNTYKITITDNFFGKFTGEFLEDTKQEAMQKAKEYYAHELDTSEEYIEVLEIILIED